MKKMLILLTISFVLSGCTAKVPKTEYDALATEKAVLAEQMETLTSKEAVNAGMVPCKHCNPWEVSVYG